MPESPAPATTTEVPPKDAPVDTYAPPWMMLVLGIPVLAVVMFFVMRWARPPEPPDEEDDAEGEKKAD